MARAIQANEAEATSGNAIAKVCAVLRSLMAKGPVRLSEVAEIAGLNRVTTLRILDTLVKEGFVERRGAPARYVFGPEVAAMAAVSSRATDLLALSAPSLIRLAAETEDTALLSVRVNVESVCLGRQTGAYPIQANFLQVGSRRPLGVGAGSMALLAWMTDSEIDAVLEVNAPALLPYPRINDAVLRSHIQRARALGYVLMVDIVVEKMSAIGVPIADGSGTVIGSLSVAALTERILSREQLIAAAMLREAARIEREIGRRAPRDAHRPRGGLGAPGGAAGSADESPAPPPPMAAGRRDL